MQIDDLIGEITAAMDANDEKRAGIAAVALLGGFLKDVRRIADAFENVNQIINYGDLMVTTREGS